MHSSSRSFLEIVGRLSIKLCCLSNYYNERVQPPPHAHTHCYSELISWVKDTSALMVADELAKDVASAEALLQRHRERKEEIDAQEGSFKTTSQFGLTLISSGHFASQEIKEKVLCTKSREITNLFI